MEQVIKQITPSIIAVGLPEGAERPAMGFEDNTRLYYYFKNANSVHDHRHIKLPGYYTIIGFVSGLTPEQKAEVCGQGNPFSTPMFRDFSMPEYLGDAWIEDLEQSFATLVEAYKLDKNTLLIKREV